MERESFFKRFANFFRNSFKNLRDFIVEHMPRRREKVHRIDAYVNNPVERREHTWDRAPDGKDNIQPEKETPIRDQEPEPGFEFNERAFRDALKDEIEKIFTSEDMAPPVDESVKLMIDEIYNKCINSGDQTIEFPNGYSIAFKQIETGFIDEPFGCDVFLMNPEKEIESVLYNESDLKDRNELTSVYAVYSKMQELIKEEQEKASYPSAEEVMPVENELEHPSEWLHSYQMDEDEFSYDLYDGDKLLVERDFYQDGDETKKGIVKVSLHKEADQSNTVLYDEKNGLNDIGVVYDAILSSKLEAQLNASAKIDQPTEDTIIDKGIEILNSMSSALNCNDGYIIIGDGSIRFFKEFLTTDQDGDTIEAYNDVTFDKNGVIIDQNGYFDKEALEAVAHQITTNDNLKAYLASLKDDIELNSEVETKAEDAQVSTEMTDKSTAKGSELPIEPDASWGAEQYYKMARLSAFNHPDGKSYLELQDGNKLLFEKQDVYGDTDVAVYLMDKKGDITNTVYSLKDGLMDEKAVYALINGESSKTPEVSVPTEEEYKAHVAEVLADKDNSFKLKLDDGRTILVEKQAVVKQNYYLLDENGNLEKPLYIPESNVGSQDEIMKCLHGDPTVEMSKAESLFNLHRLNVIKSEWNSHLELPNGKTLAFTPIGVNNKEQMVFDCNVRLINESGFIEQRLYQPLEKIGSKTDVIKFLEESFELNKQIDPQPAGREDLETPREKAIADVVKDETQPPQYEMIEDMINKAIETQEDQIISLPGGKVIKFEPDTLYAKDGQYQTASVFLMNERGELEKKLYGENLSNTRMLNDIVTTGSLRAVNQCIIEQSHGPNSLDETIDEKRQEMMEAKQAEMNKDPEDRKKYQKDDELSA